jgi:AcrR family transcriptional regulator
MTVAEIKQAPRRRQRNSLSSEVILDAAQDLVASGHELSIRAVASVLACTPMALYRYFPGKSELLLALLDRVFASMPLHRDVEGWDDRLLSLCGEHLKILQRNPWAIPLLQGNPDPGPAVRLVGEAILESLKLGGASNRASVVVFSAILAVNYGWAGFTARPISEQPAAGARVTLAGEGPSAEILPNTAALWADFESLGSDKDHQDAIRRLVRDLDQP